MTTRPNDGEPCTLTDFAKIEIRAGTVVDAKLFPTARKPAYRLWIDFGAEIGTRTSSAQITARYARDELVGRQVLAVVNLPPRRIGPFLSEVLTLGVADARGDIALVHPDGAVPDGSRLH